MDRTSSTPAALIVGGGIAGAATAYWLDRIGWHVTVVEKAPDLRAGGQVVDLRGRSRDVVAAMGLLDELTSLRMPERGTAVWDRRGRRVADLGAELFDGDGPVAELEILRTDLGRVLAGAATGAEWRFDDTVVGLEDDGAGVDVTLASGGSLRVDLVVGADGLHSGVRRRLFGAEEHLVEHLGGSMAYWTVPMPDGLDDGFFHVHSMPGRALMLRSDRMAGRAKAIVAFRSGAVRYDRLDRPAREALLTDRFADGAWVTPQIMAALPHSPDLYLDTLARVTLPAWSSGRVGLVGDAAYCGSPLTGQGTAMAIVGAYVLATALARHDDDVRGGLTTYERLLRPYVADRQRLPGGGLAAMAPRTRIGVWAATGANRLLARRWMRPVLQRLVPAEDTFELPGPVPPSLVRR